MSASRAAWLPSASRAPVKPPVIGLDAGDRAFDDRDADRCALISKVAAKLREVRARPWRRIDHTA
jgi:hypothetical protein